MRRKKAKSKDITIAITGHRSPTRSDQQIIKETMEKICLNKKVKEIVFGGAQGVDTVALLNALYLKEMNPFLVFPKLTVMLPCTIFCI